VHWIRGLPRRGGCAIRNAATAKTVSQLDEDENTLWPYVRMDKNNLVGDSFGHVTLQ